MSIDQPGSRLFPRHGTLDEPTDPARIIEAPLPQCLKCGGLDVPVQRTERRDGDVIQRRRCESCQWRFFYVLRLNFED